MPTIYFIAEIRKWQAFGLGCVGLGDTPDAALAAWQADYARVHQVFNAGNPHNKEI